MKLTDCIGKVGKYERIKVSVGYKTIFDGKKADVTENEWKSKFRPYMDCNVIKFSVDNNVTVMMI
jgi:hypothetical protein